MKKRQKLRKRNCCWNFFVFISAKIYLLIIAITLKNILHNHFNISNLISVICSLLVAFSLAILIWFHKCSQCIFLLTIPQLVSRRGRLFLLASAFFIAFSHPTKNLMSNAEILSDCLSCTQVRKLKIIF